MSQIHFGVKMFKKYFNKISKIGTSLPCKLKPKEDKAQIQNQLLPLMFSKLKLIMCKIHSKVKILSKKSIKINNKKEITCR